jgi:chromosome segregation ATPase
VVLFSSKKVPSDPVAALTAQLAAVRAKREGVATRLAAAERNSASKRREINAAATDADDAALDVLEGSLRAFEDRGRTLVAAVGQLDADISAFEEELATAQRQRQADQVSAELRKMADAIAKAAPERFGATNAIINTIRSNTVSTSEATRVADNLAETENQVCEAVSLLLAELRSGAESVRTGAAPFRLQGPAGPVEAPAAVALPISAFGADQVFQSAGLR